MNEGIYILANDVVFDQLVALVNSIRVNTKKMYPICIIPYDDRLDRTRQYAERCDEVSLLDDAALIERWEAFSAEIWQHSPAAIKDWQERGLEGVSRMGMHRRFCAFEGLFERYIYLDADTLVLNELDIIFDKLNDHDWVVYDFQYKDITHVFDASSSKLKHVFSEGQLESIFCAGMYASKRNIFSQSQLDWLLEQLKEEAEILYYNGPDQSIVNYMTLKLGIDVCNLSKTLAKQEVTGCCVTSPHFEQKNGYLLDKGVRLTYLHYIGISSKIFKRLCQGENLDFPYRDIFLHYRYLNTPGDFPDFNEPLRSYQSPPLSMTKKLKRKFSKMFGNG